MQRTSLLSYLGMLVFLVGCGGEEVMPLDPFLSIKNAISTHTTVNNCGDENQFTEFKHSFEFESTEIPEIDRMDVTYQFQNGSEATITVEGTNQFLTVVSESESAFRQRTVEGLIEYRTCWRFGTSNYFDLTVDIFTNSNLSATSRSRITRPGGAN